MPFNRITWTNSVSTPLNATNLNRIEAGIVEAGQVPIMAEIVGSANLTLTATYQTAVSTTFTAPVAGKLLVAAVFDVTFGSSTDFVNGQLKIDTVLVGRDVVGLGSVNRISIGKTWTVSVAAGSHTIEIGGSRFQGAGSSFYSGPQTGFSYQFVPGAG